MLGLFLIILASVCSPVLSQDETWTLGSGSRFTVNLEGAKGEVWIYVADKTNDSISIEMHMRGIAGAQLWLQSELSIPKKGTSVELLAGYLKRGAESPKKVNLLKLAKKDGFQMKEFLISSEDQIDGLRIGPEKITTPAGTVSAIHYRKERNGEIIDFWISKSARPISLIRLSSKGKHTYTMELESLVKNVQAEIKPAETVVSGDLPNPFGEFLNIH